MSAHGCPSCGGRNVDLKPVHTGKVAPATIAGLYHIDDAAFVFEPDCMDCGWVGETRKISAEPVAEAGDD